MTGGYITYEKLVTVHCGPVIAYHPLTSTDYFEFQLFAVEFGVSRFKTLIGKIFRNIEIIRVGHPLRTLVALIFSAHLTLLEKLRWKPELNFRKSKLYSFN